MSPSQGSGGAGPPEPALRVFRPRPYLLAYYEGRTPDRARWRPAFNWFDDLAVGLGTASFAVVDGTDALVYDTHASVAHGRWIRRHLEGLGVRRLRVLLSHWHVDHVAGNEAFADCEIIACRLTAERLALHRIALEGGTQAGPPAIRPLVLPTTTFEDRLSLRVGGLAMEAQVFDIHSRDGVVLLVPDDGTLLAGDTLEDTVTYVAEPEGLVRQLAELDRLEQLPVARIYPNHGDPGRIAGAGYDRSLIGATRRYVRALLASAHDPALAARSLREVVADDLAAGTVLYWPAYEPVHALNVAAVAARGPR